MSGLGGHPSSAGAVWGAVSGVRRRGPKGYVRSDARLTEEVCERLHHALHLDVSDVSVEVRDGCVMLEGTVPLRSMKHEIEDIADGVMGVRDVDNRVRVQRDSALVSPGPGPSAARTQAGAGEVTQPLEVGRSSL